MLANYYATGVWEITHEYEVPYGEYDNDLNQSFRTRPKKVEQDMIRMLILHSLFLFSTCFHLTVASYLFAYIRGFF